MPRIGLYRSTVRRRLLKANNARESAEVRIILSEKTLERLIGRLMAPPPELKAEHKEVTLRPSLRPWVEVIDQIVKEDAGLPKRLRTSAMRILQKLRDEHGYTGGYTVVQEYVRQARNPADARNDRKAKNTSVKTAAPNVEPPNAELQPSVIIAKVEPLREEQKPNTQQDSAMIYRLSRRVQRNPEPEEDSFVWMRNVQQGSIPLEVLAGALGDIPPNDLEVLFAAATKGKLSVRNRSMAVMSYVRGIRCPEICSFLQISTGSLFRYWRDYREGGTGKLLTRKQRSDKMSNDEGIRQAVFAVLHSPPSAHGFNRTSWRMADLVKVLSRGSRPVGSETIRTVIKESGFKWRHARIVLTSNDPDYRSKVEAITNILSELREDEAFFSIDEYGPFAIKMKGGKKRVAPGDQYVVPQWQRSKCWMILTAALELSKNQVTHFYSRKKNTAEMIKMADTLRSQYRGFKTVYLSWDAASWHVSKDLVAHLERINREAVPAGFPTVKTAPLPAGAQFLNVIESVFSGMARAIIHNSDYPSVEKAREAIDRYLDERNRHFAQNPKRAGQKIWGKERVPSTFSEGQNCKDPMYQYLT